MRIRFNHVSYIISFAKRHDVCYDGYKQLNTVCFIKYADCDNLISAAIAFLSRKDKYNKVTGKKVSLAKALKAAHFNLNFREHVWEQFIEEFGISETKEKDDAGYL